MTLKITHKHGTTAGTPPAAGDIDVGEIAINAADAEIYTKDTSGNVRKFQNTTSNTAENVAYTYPGSGELQTVQQRLEQYVSVKDFGAVGDGVTDDTVAIQACIDANQNKTVFFPKGTYKITSHGTVELGAYATGEAAESIAYCLKTSSTRTRLKGDGAILKGTWDGTPSLTSPIGVVSDSGNEEHAFEALTFEDLQFGIANVKKYVNTQSFAVLCKYRDLIFDNVGVGIYALAFERCDFRFIAGKNNALCLIAQGGIWNNANNTQADASGFLDKCTMKNIINIGNPAGSVTANSAAFDTWFDDHFFKTSKNSSLSPSGAGPGTTYPYQGISGRTIYAMARYSRPHNCNTINLVTHINQHRGAVCFERGFANTLQGLYTENVGYADAQVRSQPIGGASATDPYLGAGVRLPYIVQGTAVESAEFQFTYAEKVFGNNVLNYERPSLTGSDITTAQTKTYRAGTLQASGGINYGIPTGNAATKTQQDYEEGTWSPVWSFTGGGTLTPTVDEASYVKIGSMVTVIFRQRTQGTIPSSGIARLEGLPYPPTGLGSAAIGTLSEWATDLSNLVGFAHPDSFIRFYKNISTGSNEELNKTDFTDGTDKNRLYLAVTYFTTDP